MALWKIYKIINSVLRRYIHRCLFYSQKKDEDKLSFLKKCVGVMQKAVAHKQTDGQIHRQKQN